MNKSIIELVAINSNKKRICVQIVCKSFFKNSKIQSGWADSNCRPHALQEYGMVVVDVAGGSPINAEGLYGQPGKSWEGILRDWEGGINDIPLDHYRVLKLPETIKKGDARWKSQDPFQVN